MTTISRQPMRPIVLVILDGWGYSQNMDHNPTYSVDTPTIDGLYSNQPYMLLEASGPAVGLPLGQMGNSEVGHLHIGAGRKVPQDLTRINLAIADRTFFSNAVFLEAIHDAKNTEHAIHIVGLLSHGGVHSLDQHIAALIQMLHAHGVRHHYLHAILDGRDTPPQSAAHSITLIEKLYTELGSGSITSIIGRYYAMDRDQRWERTQKAYNLLTAGQADSHYTQAISALEQAYQSGITDEFIPAISIHAAHTEPITIQNGDVVIFMNFRADRARQLSYAFTEKNFSHFKREHIPELRAYITLTEYGKNIQAISAFPALTLKNTLGEYVAQQGLTQLRMAETEKYAHVTYFINGGHETPFPREERILIPSPRIATYDLQPQMHAAELTQALITAIQSKKYDLIICNYANPDMVGHTGKEDAAAIAVRTIDQCLEKIIAALQTVGGEALITADHGNIECMFDDIHQQPHTAHTNNLVPLFYCGNRAIFYKKHGALDDIAPTLLFLLGLPIPPEMTGTPLLTLMNNT